MNTIISNPSFQCRITKPVLFLIIHFCAKNAAETSEVINPIQKQLQLWRIKEQVKYKEHTFLYIKQGNHSHIYYIYACQAF